MTFASAPPVRRFLLVSCALALSACAGSLPDVEPVDIPRLQERLANSPNDTNLQVQLGMAQFKASDFDAARASLQSAIDGGNESGAAYLYLGMVQEELLDWSAAREAYTQYLEVGTSSAVRSDVRNRLTLIGRNLLRAQAQQALAQEAEIAATTAVTPQSVAVLPMAFNATNQDLEPLIYALADMMVTDFQISNALTVLERSQIQTLLDEMSLESSGYALPGTGARAGRMLRAEHVVQGVLNSLGGDDLQTEADILNVVNAASAGTVTESAVLEQIFDMEKQIVIRTIREVLAIELTPAEEQAILDNRMSNVLAFLAHGRGLRELDNGNYAAAQAEFQTAFQLEGGDYALGEAAMAETTALIDAGGASTTDLAGVAGASGEVGLGFLGPPAGTTGDLTSMGIGDRQPVGAGSSSGQATGPGRSLNTLRNIAEGIDPTPTAGTLDLGSANQGQDQTTQQTADTVRDPVQEGAPDGLATPGATIRIVISRPGGCTVTRRTLALALLLGWAAQPVGAQVSLGSGANFQSFSFDAGLGADAAQLLMVPVAVRVPITNNFVLDLFSAWAEGRVEQGDSKFVLTGPVDTRVKASLQATPWALLSLGASIPTGNSAHSGEEAIVASVLSTDLLGFRQATWGTGFALTSSVATAATAGGFGIGVAGAYSMRQEFEPTEGEPLKYKPGSEKRVRVGVDRNFGNSTFTAGATFINYSADQAEGTNLFQSGNRLRFDGSYAFRAGDGVWTIYAADVIRDNGDLTLNIVDGAGASLGDTIVTTAKQNMLVGGLLGTVGLGGGFVFRPHFDFKYQAREEADGNKAGSGWIFAAGGDLPLRIFGGTEFFPKARVLFGSIQDTLGNDVSLIGLEIQGTIRWIF